MNDKTKQKKKIHTGKKEIVDNILQRQLTQLTVWFFDWSQSFRSVFTFAPKLHLKSLYELISLTIQFLLS